MHRKVSLKDVFKSGRRTTLFFLLLSYSESSGPAIKLKYSLIHLSRRFEMNPEDWRGLNGTAVAEGRTPTSLVSFLHKKRRSIYIKSAGSFALRIAAVLKIVHYFAKSL